MNLAVLFYQLPVSALVNHASRFETIVRVPLNGDWEDDETHLDALGRRQRCSTTTGLDHPPPDRSGRKHNKNKNKSGLRNYVSGGRSNE